ncbi:MAG: hypothetical protein ACP5EP_11475 [Acidobacteriaceae bacterium]
MRDFLHVNIAGRLDVGMPQNALRIFHASKPLQVRTQSAPHHLEGDQPLGDAELLGNRVNPAPQEIIAIARDHPRASVALPKGHALRFLLGEDVGLCMS